MCFRSNKAILDQKNPPRPVWRQPDDVCVQWPWLSAHKSSEKRTAMAMHYIDFVFGALQFWRGMLNDRDSPHHYPERQSREAPPHLLSQFELRMEWGGDRMDKGVVAGRVACLSSLSHHLLANLTNYTLLWPSLSLSLLLPHWLDFLPVLTTHI